ncbi:hypothetical protein ACFC2W_20735, partial [Bacillus velezensis]
MVTDEQSCQIAETAGQSGAVDGATEGGPVTVVTPALRRWRRRRIMQEITAIDRCRKCARRAVAPELGTLTARTEDGKASGRGVQLCESIWACAVCESAKRAEDTHELTTAALRWLARGGTLAAVVLTTRHTRADALDDLVCALWGTRQRVDETTGEVTPRVPGAYQRLLTSQSFRRHVAPAVGYIGMARNPEITRSQAGGWHPHLNLLVFLGGQLEGTPANGQLIYTDEDGNGYFEPGEGRSCTFEPPAEDLEAFEEWMHGFWAGALRSIDPTYETSTECERANCKCGGKGHGVRIDVIRSPDDKALIEYLTKVGGETAKSVQADVDAAKGAAAEVAHSTAKGAKGTRSMTAFQFLDRLWAIERDGLAEADAPGYGTAEQCRAWSLEYEAATRGRRAFEMTRGLARHTDLAGELEAYRYQEMHRRLLGGVVLTSEAHGQVAEAGSDFAVAELVAASLEAEVAGLVADAGGRADHARVVDEAGAAEWV